MLHLQYLRNIFQGEYNTTCFRHGTSTQHAYINQCVYCHGCCAMCISGCWGEPGIVMHVCIVHGPSPVLLFSQDNSFLTIHVLWCVHGMLGMSSGSRSAIVILRTCLAAAFISSHTVFRSHIHSLWMYSRKRHFTKLFSSSWSWSCDITGMWYLCMTYRCLAELVSCDGWHGCVHVCQRMHLVQAATAAGTQPPGIKIRIFCHYQVTSVCTLLTLMDVVCPAS